MDLTTEPPEHSCLVRWTEKITIIVLRTDWGSNPIPSDPLALRYNRLRHMLGRTKSDGVEHKPCLVVSPFRRARTVWLPLVPSPDMVRPLSVVRPLTRRPLCGKVWSPWPPHTGTRGSFHEEAGDLISRRYQSYLLLASVNGWSWTPDCK
jgi:hypothetical protein